MYLCRIEIYLLERGARELRRQLAEQAQAEGLADCLRRDLLAQIGVLDYTIEKLNNELNRE